ncbi:hypothetical protein VFPPC_16856 [Pochonia chlamydosporia 170]|uniref:Uncharacterized protein n=1 Tax=Pochonia chlamydosporia 170 TaxID=1380566 RepID=A0A179F2U2_METCM|nr:hypothetical protein VFPPC_16856 [Pochonia chlamydosporia 170]OAQ59746.1 hypothetical protein VFPPC_16856 [Pochonia chlamydosporia 170]
MRIWKKLRWSTSSKRHTASGKHPAVDSDSAFDRPPPSTLDDLTIRSLGGTTAALSRSPEVLKERKSKIRIQRGEHLTPSQMMQEVEQLTRENGALRREIDYLQRRLGILEPLLPKIYFLGNMLRSVAGDAELVKGESSDGPPKRSEASQSPLKQKFDERSGPGTAG